MSTSAHVTDSDDSPTGKTESRRVSLMIHAALVGVSIFAGWPLFTSLENREGEGWDHSFVQYELSRRAIVRDRQWPLWNPYIDGGKPLLAQPENPASSPGFVVVLLLGTPLGLRVLAVLFIALGATGMAALLRYWNVPPVGRLTGGVIYGLNAPFILHIAEGELHWLATALIPWVLLSVLRSRSDTRWVVFGGMFLASAITLGAFAARGVFLPLLTGWSMLESVRKRSIKPIASWLGILAVAGTLSAAKLLPEFELLQSRRHAAIETGIPPHELADAFLNPHQVEVVKQASHSAYVTWVGLALAVVGMLTGFRRHWPLIAVAAAALMLSMGNAGPVDVWKWVGRIPYCDNMGTPARYSAGTVLALALFAGLGLKRCTRWKWLHEDRLVPFVLRWTLPTIVATELLMLSATAFAKKPPIETVQLPVHQSFATRYAPRSLSAVHITPVIESESGILLSEAARQTIGVEGRPGYRGEVHMQSGNLSIEILDWSMMEQRIYVDTRLDDRLFVNLNYAKGWTAVIYDEKQQGRYAEVSEHPSGLLSVALRPGDREVKLRYLPDSFVWGVVVTVGAFLCCVAFLLVATLRRRRPQSHVSFMANT